MGGSSLLKVQERYRVAGDPLTFQTPERFGVALLAAAEESCANVKDGNASAATAAIDTRMPLRI